MKEQIQHVANIFAQNADQCLVTDLMSDKSYSYKEVKELTLKWADFLSERGVGQGDHVAVILPNGIDHIITYFALFHIGAVAVPINPGLHDKEIDQLIVCADLKMIISSQSFHKRLNALFAKHTSMATIYLKNPDADTGENGFIDLIKETNGRNAHNNELFFNTNDSDAMAIMFTSGTTSLPKGVVISYGQMFANGRAFIETMKIKKGQTWLGVFSLAYLGGLYNLLMIPLLAEGTLVLDQTFGASTSLRFWDTVREHKVSVLWLTPTMMSMLLFTKTPQDVLNQVKDQMHIGLVGTAPLAPALKQEFEAFCGFPFYENYGLSETLFISTNLVDEKSPAQSVGKIVSNCDVRIIDEDEKVCSPLKEGEICVKTAFLMKGYFEDKQLKSNIDEQGFFRTGDIGYVDENNYLYITGRKKDLIIRGGLNISPKQIEDKLMEMDEVQEVACIGVSHNIYGEEVAVVVKPKADYKLTLTEKDIVQFAAKNISQSKYPRLVYFIDEFPRSSSGKIKKQDLKLMVEEKIGVN